MGRAGVLERVLVTGSHGQLGAAFVNALSAGGEVAGVDLDTLDIAHPGRLREFVLSYRPSVILNCAAFNDVDGAESRPLAAYRVNAEAVWALAGMARDLEAVLVHYTTEFVYDGTLERPYAEDDEPAPQSVYGMTKLVGERFAQRAERSYVLRLSSLYGGHTRRTTVDWFLRQAQAGQSVTAFTDRTVSPSYVPDVVRATLELVDEAAPFGLYHCGSIDSCTWADLAERVLRACARPELLHRARSVAEPNRAVRPKNCTMSSARLCGQVAQAPRRWREALSDYFARVGVGVSENRM